MPKNQPAQDIQQPQTTLIPIDKISEAAYNPRKISRRALKGLSHSMKKFGLVQPLVWNKRTGNLVGGHQRFKVLKRKGVKEISVIVVDLTEEKEKQLNMTLNNPEIQGDWTGDAKVLLDEIVRDSGDDAADLRLDTLGREIEADLESLSRGAEKELAAETDFGSAGYQGDDTYVEVIDNVYFSSTNQWGIPDLLPKCLSTTCPSVVWASLTEPHDKKLILMDTHRWPEKCGDSYLGFYVDDFRFTSVWSMAKDFLDRVLYHDFKALVSPDFTVDAGMPPLVQLWNIYKSRWCARYWQEAGFNVIPSMQWTATQANWAMAGVPKGVPIIAMQVRTDMSTDGLAAFVSRAKQFIATLKPKRIMIYGTSKRAVLERALPKTVQYTWLEPYMDRAKRIKRSQKRAD